jgi:hypothetical protein
MRTVFHSLLLASLFSLVASPALAQTVFHMENPYIGTWDIDKQNSDFGGAEVPQTMSRTYANLGDGAYMYLVASIDPDGSLGGSSATYRYDQQLYPIANLNSVESAYISYRRENERTVEYTVQVDGEVTQIGAKTISPDNRVLTIVIQYPNSDQNNQILRFNRRR